MRRYEVDIDTPKQYSNSYNAKIRREFMELSGSGRDFYKECFEALELDGDETILNVGSGDGMDEVRWITECGHLGKIVGMEVPLGAEAHDNRFFVAQDTLLKAGLNNFYTAVGTAEAIPFPDNTFDVEVMEQVIYHADPLLAFREARRVLKPGGFLLITTNGRDNKKQQHKDLQKMAKRLKSHAPRPFSSRLDLQTLDKIGTLHFKEILARRVDQDEDIEITDEEDMRIALASIDTYWASFYPEPTRAAWKIARAEIVEQRIIRDLQLYGVSTDRLQRGGRVYANNKREVLLGGAITSFFLRK